MRDNSVFKKFIEDTLIFLLMIICCWVYVLFVHEKIVFIWSIFTDAWDDDYNGFRLKVVIFLILINLFRLGNHHES